ncbi:MAG: dihydrodipicolinate synthase family protein [Gemmatimonadales bacterium]
MRGEKWRAVLRRGVVIPAHPLALTAARKLDERRQRALTRYYLDAGAGGVAVGVHTTEFAIRDRRHGLYRPVLALAAETIAEWEARRQVTQPVVRVAGVIGPTRQAVAEARLARELGYHVALLGLGALARATDAELIRHARAVGEELPLMGFYLQPAVGGRRLSYEFWRRFGELESVVAIKIAPFDRYATWNVVRAVADSGRHRAIALYTGNDDSILVDLVTVFPALAPGVHRATRIRIVGGLLGHWAFWTRRAVELLARTHHLVRGNRLGGRAPAGLLGLAAQITDANGAIFDAANEFRGCIPGIHEILRRQGLLRGRWCLDPNEDLSPGQAAEIDRVTAAYPHLADDEFVRERLDEWLR